MQNDTMNSEPPVRRRRSDRHAPARGRRDPLFSPGASRGDEGRRAGKSASAARKKPFFTPLQLLCLAALALVCVFGAYKLADNSLKIAELRADRARAEEERNAFILRHKPLYTDLIETYASRNGIEPAYVCAVIYRESHYDPTAVSSVGARGLMQLMPDTGTWWAGNLGLKDYTSDSLFLPEVNIRLGVRYLRYLSEKFAGDPILVACGYHAGAGNVESWLKKYSSDGVTLTLDQIPMEDTRTYARRVMESYAIYLQYYYPSGGVS